MEFSALNILSILIPFEALLFTFYILSLKVERKISSVFILAQAFVFLVPRRKRGNKSGICDFEPTTSLRHF